MPPSVGAAALFSERDIPVGKNLPGLLAWIVWAGRCQTFANSGLTWGGRSLDPPGDWPCFERQRILPSVGLVFMNMAEVVCPSGPEAWADQAAPTAELLDDSILWISPAIIPL